MNRTRSAGFVITLEFLLVMVLIVLPLMVGGILIGRKLYTLYEDQRQAVEMPYSRPAVFDSTIPTAKVVGPVIGADPYEAPLILFRDDTTKAGVVLGVRPTRFTSFGPVFYTSDNCTGTGAYVRAWDAAAGTGATPPSYLYRPDGFAYQTQGVSYAMGRENILYRSTESGGINGQTAQILSVWNSQDVTPPGGVPAPPCFSVPAMDANLILNLVAATMVIDFTTTYVTPFRLAFPTPTAGPALACPNGECAP